MKKIIFSVLVFSLLCQKSQAIDFYKGTYQQTLKKAKAENKLLFLYFTASWCSPCVYMQKYIFPDTTLSTYVKQNYIPLKLDIDTEEGKLVYRKLYQIKGSTGVPAFVILNSNEEVLNKTLGGMKIEQLQAFLFKDKNQKVMYKAIADSLAKLQIQADVKKPTVISKLFFNSMVSSWKPGIKLGTNLMGYKSTPNNLGYDFGFFLDFSLKNKSNLERGFWHYSRYHFQPGLLLNSKGGWLDVTNINLNYLNLELFNGYQIKGLRGIELTASPYVSFGLWGNIYTNGSEKEVNFGEDFSHVDYGFKAGLGKQFGTFQANLGYNIGLKDIGNLIGSGIFNRGFYFTIGMTVGK